MEEVDVEGVTSFPECRLEVVRAVKVSLNLEVRSIVQHALPAGYEIPLPSAAPFAIDDYL